MPLYKYLLSPCTDTNFEPADYVYKLENKKCIEPARCTNVILKEYSPQKCTEPARCTNVKLTDVLTYCKV